MVRQPECKACAGSGMQADDEGWQYNCSVCNGTGVVQENQSTRVLSVDENNRLLD
ncbi:MAG TPA: hypothetical protein VF095_02095 [Bacillota bacterium]